MLQCAGCANALRRARYTSTHARCEEVTCGRIVTELGVNGLHAPEVELGWDASGELR